MSTALNHFNHVAHVYDLLAGIVFGGRLSKAQQEFLSQVPQGAEVLVLGGGTGKFLEDLFEVNPGCRVDYVEASSSMIRLAAGRLPAAVRSRVEFIHGTEDDIPGRKYDAVITYFFLDILPRDSFGRTVTSIHAALERGGIWLVSDFRPPRRWWQGMMLKAMYAFFRLTAGIKTSSLPAWEIQLRSHGMVCERWQLYFGNFIKTALYRKVTEKR